MGGSLYHTRDSFQQIFASKFVTTDFCTSGSKRRFTLKEYWCAGYPEVELLTVISSAATAPNHPF
jgi:hypothetical protein